MIAGLDAPADRRALVLAPRGRDAAVVAHVLDDAGTPTAVCATIGELAAQMDTGCATIFVTEEALDDAELPLLLSWLERQPPWSDLPMIVLATRHVGRRSAQASARLAQLGNVVVLERPLNAETLTSAARSAVRARDRQYQLRSHLDEQARISRDNERLYAAESSARAEAERVSRLKDEFLATLSHELRTPLSAIMGWTHLLRRGGAAPEMLMRAAETIERNARAQSRLIEEMLDVSRIVAGSLRLEIEPVDVAETLVSAMASLQPAALAKSITIESSLAPGLGVVAADPHRLQQMLWNLLSNAVKFTASGGKVEVAATRDANALEIRVTDNGAGIAPEFLPFVFERFRQADASTTRAHGGLGLGLAIVRHLAELHGGTVGVASAGLGRGASFTLRLPVGRALPDPTVRPESTRDEASLDLAMPDVDLAGLRIVAVDDDPDGRELLYRILAGQGARVFSAAAADEALVRVEQERPDLLISDIAMPGTDGYELIRRVRRLAPRLPAIALTAFARSEDRRLALAAGFQLHLSKPVEPAELVRAVTELTAIDRSAQAR